jgi:uncharacterized membrane protein
LDLWEILVVFLLSTTKFVFGAVPLALAAGFSFFEAVTVTSLGGFVGCTFFTIMSDRLLLFFRQRRERRDALDPANIRVRRKFSRQNRTIVRVKHRFGLIGIALLTPLLFSIPLGCFLAVRYFKHKRQILMYMFASILFWSVSISSFKLFF